MTMEVESRIHLSSKALINLQAQTKQEKTFLNPLLDSRLVVEIQDEYEDDFEEEIVNGFLNEFSCFSDVRCKFRLVSSLSYEPSPKYVFDITGAADGYSVNGGKRFDGLNGLTLEQVWNDILFKPRAPLCSYQLKRDFNWKIDHPPLPDSACLVVYDRYLLSSIDLKVSLSHSFLKMLDSLLSKGKKRQLDLWIFVEAQPSKDANAVAESAMAVIKGSSLKAYKRLRVAIFLISKNSTHFEGAHDRYYIFDTFSLAPGNSLNGEGRTGMLYLYRHVEGQSGSIGTLEVLPALRELLRNWREKTHARFEAVKFSSPSHEKGMLKDGFSLSVAPSLGMNWEASEAS